jgi:hypothetical protein
MSFWDWIVTLVTGKRVAVLGPRAAGKTTLQTYLREGTIVATYEPTLSATEAGYGRREVKELPGAERKQGVGKVAVKKGRDVPGDSKANQAAWREQALEYDVVLYLFDAHKVLNGARAMANRIVYDCDLIGGFLEQRLSDGGSLPKAAIVGTHCDLDDAYQPPNKGTAHMAYWAKVTSRKAVTEAQENLSKAYDDPVPVVVGSLKDAESAGELTWRVLKQELDI